MAGLLSMKNSAVALLGTACIVAAWPTPRATFKLDPVPTLNVEAYMGRWFQMYDNLVEQFTFENASLCDTADYALLPNGTITVLNRERQISVDGPERAITGHATCPENAPPACSVYLDLVPVPAPYYIVNLGPAEESLYQWAVVSDPLGLSLFILARNVTDYYSRFDADVLAWCKGHGFNTIINEPLKTQQLGCKYW